MRQRSVVTIMPLAQGKELLDHIEKEKHRNLSVKDLLKVGIDICNSIWSLQENKDEKGEHDPILHRDIKLENLIVDFVTGKVSLVDFGLAAFARNEKSRVRVLAGTVAYAAKELDPENPDKPQMRAYDEKTEVFALGKVLGILFGFLSSPLDNIKYLAHQSHPGLLKIAETHPELYTKLYVLIRAMLDKSCDQRPTIKQVRVELNNIFKHFFKFSHHIQRVGIINCDEYEKGSEEERKKIRQAIKDSNVSKVRLLDIGHEYEHRYAIIRKELDLEGVPAEAIAYSAPKGYTEKQALEQIPKQKHSSTNPLEIYFYISDSPYTTYNISNVCMIRPGKEKYDIAKKTIDFMKKQRLSQKQVNYVNKELKRELDRLTSRWYNCCLFKWYTEETVNKRIYYLKRTMKQIKINTSFHDLEQLLGALENNMNKVFKESGSSIGAGNINALKERMFAEISSALPPPKAA